MRGARRVLAAVVLLLHLETAAAAEANPLRKVITMLQMMKKKVEGQGELEASLFSKYECFCTTGKTNLEMSIATGEKKVPQLEGQLTGGLQKVEQLGGDVIRKTQEKKDLTQKMDETSKMRDKDHASYLKESSEQKADIEALGKAITALEKGVGGSFLQTPAADVLRQLVQTRKVSAGDSEVLSVFLSVRDSSVSTGPTDEVIGICKQMQSTMKEVLSEVHANEKKSVSDFLAMKAATEAELTAVQADIEMKMERKSKQQVNNVAMQEDLDTSTEELAEDKTFYKETADKCKSVEDAYRDHQASRSAELVALADTIAVLSNDDSLETIKKAAMNSAEPGAAASFLQVRAATSMDRRKEALKLLRLARAARHNRYSAKLDLLELALRGRHAGFDKIVEMIDSMVRVLKEEQGADDKKKDYCREEFHSTEGSLTGTKTKLKDTAKSMEDDNGTLKTIQEEVDSIIATVKQIDTMVVAAKAARKANNGEFVELIAQNGAALQIIEVAEKRLISFYNKQLGDFNPPEAEEQVFEEPPVNPNVYGPGAMTVMKGMTGLVEEYKPKYEKQTGGSSKILEMLSTIKVDINTDSHEAEIEENNHKASFAMMLGEAEKKRRFLLDTLTEKENAKTSIILEIDNQKAEGKSLTKEVEELKKYLHNLHNECDWLVKNYGMRKEARAEELDALKNGKDVLHGAR